MSQASQNSVSITAESVALERAYSAAVGDTLQPVGVGLAILYILFTAAHLLLLPPPMRWVMSSLAFGSALFLLALAEAARRKPPTGQSAHAGSAMIGLVVLVNSASHMALSREVVQSTNLILLVVGIGIFFLSLRWLLGALLTVYATWALAMYTIGAAGADWVHYGFGLVSASLLALLAHRARKRMLRRVTLLRLQDEEHAEQLQSALVAEQESEAELRDSEARYRLLNQELTHHIRELDKANIELGRAARLKDDFLATVSHELRTPLNAILGLNEALQENVYGQLSTRQRDALNRMAKSGDHLLSLINDILDVAKIEAGKVTLDLARTDVPELCESSLALLRPVAEEKRQVLHLALDPAVQALWADERRMKQVLVNLLSNAVKFTPVGGAVGLEVMGDPANQRVQFTVWDTGIGIAPQDFERLFKPFIQLDSRLARSYTGTGLGLVLVHRLVESHGGSVAVESQVNIGSQFRVVLPWRQLDPELAATPTVASNLATAIVIADAPEAHQTWRADVVLPGCQIITTTSRHEALEQARAVRPALVIIDQRLSQLAEQELIDSFRYDAALTDTPVVITTSLDLPGARERWLATGARGYWNKPISAQKIAKFLESATLAH